MSHAGALWLSLFLLLGNAFFVGAEFAVMTARRSRLEPLAAAGSKRAKVSLEALEQVASLLATAQLGITLCSVGLGAVAEQALHEIISPALLGLGLSDSLSTPIALVVALLIVAYLHVVVGEMVPQEPRHRRSPEGGPAAGTLIAVHHQSTAARDPADGGSGQGNGPGSGRRAQG